MGLRVLRTRPIATALTVGIVASIGVLYTEAVLAHLSVYQIPVSEVTLSGFSLTPDDAGLRGTIRFENVASREVIIYGANVMLSANGTTIAGPASTSTNQTTVPPGGSVTVPARVDFDEGRVQAGAAAYRNGTLIARGFVYAGFGDQNFKVGFDPHRIRPPNATGGERGG